MSLMGGRLDRPPPSMRTVTETVCRLRPVDKCGDDVSENSIVRLSQVCGAPLLGLPRRLRSHQDSMVRLPRELPDNFCRHMSKKTLFRCCLLGIQYYIAGLTVPLTGRRNCWSVA